MQQQIQMSCILEGRYNLQDVSVCIGMSKRYFEKKENFSEDKFCNTCIHVRSGAQIAAAAG